ncbi:MAG: hypothetical protein WCA12_20410 [Burkholderiales bacterium]
MKHSEPSMDVPPKTAERKSTPTAKDEEGRSRVVIEGVKPAVDG